MEKRKKVRILGASLAALLILIAFAVAIPLLGTGPAGFLSSGDATVDGRYPTIIGAYSGG